MQVKLLQFTVADVASDPVAINPVHVCRINRCGDDDDNTAGTMIWLVSGFAVLVAESYETVLDALQSVEVGP